MYGFMIYDIRPISLACFYGKQDRDGDIFV